MHQPTALLVAYLCEKKGDPGYVDRAMRELEEIERRSLGERVAPRGGVRMLDTGSDLSPLCVSREALAATLSKKAP